VFQIAFGVATTRIIVGQSGSAVIGKANGGSRPIDIGSPIMPIEQLLKSSAFDQEEIKAMTIAFEAVLHTLELRDQNGPKALTLAKSIIECAKSGERDPTRLREYALKASRRG
jgi:hypothetical protein